MPVKTIAMKRLKGTKRSFYCDDGCVHAYVDFYPAELVEKIVDDLSNQVLEERKKWTSMFDHFKAKRKELSESDRDRFVGRFFRKYTGKYFVMMDKTTYGRQLIFENDTTAYFSFSTPLSVYSPKYNMKPVPIPGSETVFRMKKTYLYISGFEAVNELYGLGYIKMTCFDSVWDRVEIKLDHNNLLYLQFKEITKMEFDYVAKLFSDDRDDRPYRLTRYVIPETAGGKKDADVIRETLEVHAKDTDDARRRYTNVLSVERVE